MALYYKNISESEAFYSIKDGKLVKSWEDRVHNLFHTILGFN